MALKLPFNDVRLAPGQEASQERLEELLQGIQENLDFLSLQFPVNRANLASPDGPKPVIVGAVKATGEKEAGQGFTCSKTGTGAYKIELTKELPTVGILVATQIGGASPAVMITGSPAKKVFNLEAYKAAVALETINTAFTFHIKAS